MLTRAHVCAHMRTRAHSRTHVREALKRPPEVLNAVFS